MDLLLVGKTGNGRSATGNSILGRKVFESKSSATPVTSEVKKDEKHISGQLVTVTDIPGLAYSEEENFEKAKQKLDEAARMTAHGFNAILIVLRFGERFTREDEKTITVIKKLLGGDKVLNNHCICVMTCGDNFEKELEHGEFGSFDEWRHQQTGNLKKLFNECQDRCVLFDNMTRNQKKKDHQVEELMSKVRELKGRHLAVSGHVRPEQ